ncbi:spore germination protein GerM [Marinithermofilum abyssi]|uniref:Spore germination protein GerM n=1 Tax=Marinithermofilum abyssi TaxID=1571185 RepID=A0A8J2VHS4_9BACL|nr:GerMN domain-containing protein [Marinithermofilum abyssi]GGE18179.1 spore germination protein GerM [Marinithermofilum abyssi]
MRKGLFRAALVLLLFPLVLTGCLFGPEEKASAPIDPPPKQEIPEGKIKGDEHKTEAKKGDDLELYFLSDSGYVVPYSLNVPKVEGIAKEAISYMVKGGSGEPMLPEGFSGILPKGTKVKGLSIQGKTATIDFSKEFLSYDPKMEEKILSAVTWTLTGFDSVEKVNIWVNGKPLKIMPKGKSPAQELTRNQGINLEIAQGVSVSQSIPVTLYFLGQSSDNTIYYVPVTRMINRKDDIAKATLQELVKGPQQGSTLSSALTQTLQVNSVKMKGDLAVADFGKQLLQFGEGKQASKDAINTIVLSLTENTAAKKVKITVDGKSGAVSQGKTLSKPVNRPAMINPGEY